MDNCEHLLEAAAQVVTDLLGAAPDLRVIATSREPLQVSGEQVIPVSPLELPPADGEESLGQLQQNEAIRLFSERAAAASGAFELTSSNKAAVVAVCRRLDGLPLAIELAAVRTRRQPCIGPFRWVPVRKAPTGDVWWVNPDLVQFLSASDDGLCSVQVSKSTTSP